MTTTLSDQIAELQSVHTKLTSITKCDGATVLSGSLPFEATADGYDAITETFDIQITIPVTYPKELPRVKAIGDKFDRNYDHLFNDETFCLAVPIEQRQIFSTEPTLLGFVNKLLIPYLFGYCHWKSHGSHPFGEQRHGPDGIVDYYTDLLGLCDRLSALYTVAALTEFGYRGHHACPCGSGIIVRKCHGKILRSLYNLHSEDTLKTDFVAIITTCLADESNGKLEIPSKLRAQLIRVLNNQKIIN